MPIERATRPGYPAFPGAVFRRIEPHSMESRDASLGSDAVESKPRAVLPRRGLTAAHLEPWKGNIIDVTMLDGSHKIGLLERMEEGTRTARLRTVGGVNDRPQVGVIQIADVKTIERASRN